MKSPWLWVAALSISACVGKVGPGASNVPPVARAGAEQSVLAGATVTLDASASSDPDGDVLGFDWAQTGGGAVALSQTSGAKVTFTAPAVATATTLVFRVTVSDGKASDTASTAVTVQPVGANQPPVARALAPSQVASGAMVTLDGSTSSDPDGDSLAFSWSQTAGPTATLVNGGTAQTTFVAPTVTQSTALGFKLDVNDGHGGTASASVSLTVVPASSNHAPVANAGPDASATAGAQVTLDGSGSSDPDGDAITYAWTQVGGPTVTLSSATASKPTFTAPQVSATTALTFSLTVTDAPGLSANPDTVTVTVNPASLPQATITKVVSLHAVTRTGIVVFFLTDVAVAASVQYGPTSLANTVTEPSAVTRHVVSLTGLSPDTHYQYKVQAGTASCDGHLHHRARLRVVADGVQLRGGGRRPRARRRGARWRPRCWRRTRASSSRRATTTTRRARRPTGRTTTTPRQGSSPTCRSSPRRATTTPARTSRSTTWRRRARRTATSTTPSSTGTWRSWRSTPTARARR